MQASGLGIECDSVQVGFDKLSIKDYVKLYFGETEKMYIYEMLFIRRDVTVC